ncbi:MAG TPA: hypothetical protein VGM07_16545 [Stellaceae bacterium]
MTYGLNPAVAPADDHRLAKVLGVLAVTASAVAAEYGAGINFVSTQSLAVYPGVHGLVPLTMFITGILMLPKTYLYVMFSRVMPRAGSKHVWIVMATLVQKRPVRINGKKAFMKEPNGKVCGNGT